MPTQKYNPYSIALSLLTETLTKDNIPLVSNNINPTLSNSIPEEGFDSDKLKEWLVNYQRNNTKTKRTYRQYNAYEVLSCPRQMYYLRQGAPYDGNRIAQYPYSTIKASMGEVVEKLLLSMYNQCDGTKWRNGIRLNWNPVSYNLQYPFNIVIDGLSYNEDVILDCKFTDTPDDFHINQVKLYALAYEEMMKKECIKFIEVIYLNSSMNTITRRREAITDETRKNEFPNIINRIQRYDYCLRNHVLPDPEKHNCNFCLYESICKRNENYVDCQKAINIGQDKPNNETELKLPQESNTSNNTQQTTNDNNLTILF